MKSSIRWAGIALAGALALAGCGSSDEPTAGPTTAGLPPCPLQALNDAPGPVEIVMWYQLSGKAHDVLLSQVDKYNRSQSKVRVRAEQQGASYEELFDAYKRGIPTKELPNIAAMEETTTQFMVDSKTVLPAQSCFEAEKLGTEPYNQAAVKYYTVNGVFYPASASLSDLITYYNRSHFTKAGLDPDKPPTTLEEVRTAAQKIKAAGIADKPLVMKLAPWFVETELTGDKQPMVDNDNGHGAGQTSKATFNTDVTRRIYTWTQEMIRDGLMNPKPDTPGQFDHYGAMAQSTASMTIETSTAATTIAAFLSGDTEVGNEVGAGSTTRLTKADVGAAPVFGVKRAGAAQVGGNAFFMTNTGTDDKQAASWDFLKWWNQPEQQKVWHMEGSYLPFLTSTTDLPEVKEFWANDTAGKILKVAWEELSTGIDPQFPGALIGPFRETRDIMRQSLDNVAFAGGDPTAAVTQAVTETDKAIADYNTGL
jgi:sn-glycerol 3-phosphate transport system substrate-binding protein